MKMMHQDGSCAKMTSPKGGDCRISTDPLGSLGWTPLEVSAQLMDPFLRHLPWHGHMGKRWTSCTRLVDQAGPLSLSQKPGTDIKRF